MGQVVLDSSIILALFDPEDALHASSAQAVRRHRSAGARLLMPSSVLAEVLVGAARQGDDELSARRAQAVAAFGPPVPMDEDVVVAAAKLRADHRALRLPDAIVLATATITKAETVLTGDKRWRRIDPRVETVEVAQPSADQAVDSPNNETMPR